MTEMLKLAVAIQGVNQFSTAFNQASAGIGGIKGAARGMSAGMAAAGGAIAFMAAGAAASFISSSIEMAAGFEKEMLRVQAVTGATGEQYEELTGFAKNLGETTEFTARESASAMSAFGMAGFDVNEIYEATPVALNLATAGMTDMGTAAGVTANIIRAFGLETSDAVRVGDVLTETFTSSFTTVESLGESFKMAAPLASSAGISFEATAAAIGKLGDAGLQGTMAGTGLRQAITKILTPTDDATKAISRLGLDIQTFTDAGIGMKSQLDAQLPALEALETQSVGLATESQNLSIQMSEIGIAVGENNTEIAMHESSITSITSDYTAWDDEINSLKGDLLGLQGIMSGFSLDMKKNNLAVMEIRQQADRQNRELNASELAQISELQEMNDEVRIKREQASIQQMEMQSEVARKETEKSAAIQQATSVEVASIAQLKASNASLNSQRQQLQLTTQQNALSSTLTGINLDKQRVSVDQLTESLGTQVTGTADFVTILQQLDDAGATTSDVLEIFSTRGGSAMLALQKQGVDSLATLTDSLINSEGAMDGVADTIRGSMSVEMDLMKSKWEAFQIELGTKLFPVLRELFTIFQDDILPALSDVSDIFTDSLVPIFVNGVLPAFKFLLVLAAPILSFLGDNPPLIWLIIGALIAWKVAQLILNATMLANPIGLIIIAVVALIAIIWLIVDNWDAISGALGAIWDGITSAFMTVVGFFKTAFVAIGTAIAAPFILVYDTIIMVKDMIMDFIDTIKGVVEEVTSLGGLTDIGGTIGGVLGFATGTGESGAPKTGMYQLHESEIVLNKSESDVVRRLLENGQGAGGEGGGGGGGVTYNVNIGEINANDEAGGRAAARAITDELRSLNARGDSEGV